MKRVFISYAREGSRRLAELLARRLREAGLDAWRDEERIRGGDPIDAVLDEAIKTSDAIVFLITREWLTRAYPQTEVIAAAAHNRAGRHIRRIPLLCAADAELEQSLPLSL